MSEVAEEPVSRHPERKRAYYARLKNLLTSHSKALFVAADNVGSKQMQTIRMELRGIAQLLMGKNTMIRKAIRELVEGGNTELECMLPHIIGNTGIIFISEGTDMTKVKDILAEFRRPAGAKTGAVAPIDVWVPAGPTQLEPGQTTFLQVLSIATKITKSKIEILNDILLCTKGNRVGPSEAALLQKLDIRPFSYGLEMIQIYDNGVTYDPVVLSLSGDDIIGRFMSGVSNVAAVSLLVGIPTVASVPHSVIDAFKNILAISVETEYTFPESEKVKAYLADPSAFAAAAAPAAGEAAPAAEAAKEPTEESEEEDMDFDLFG